MVLFELFIILINSDIKQVPVEKIDGFLLRDIGLVLYTDYFFVFQITGFLLFVAMIGAIILTLRDDQNLFTKRQNIFRQVSRKRSDSVMLAKVGFGKKIDR